MAPIHTKTMPSASDRRIEDIEQTFSDDLRETAREVMQDLDRNGSIESTRSDESLRRVVSTESAQGEPISTRDLFSSDSAYEIAAAAAKNQIEQSSGLKNIGNRIASMRDNF